MEITFLKMLNWKTFVDPMEHHLYHRLVLQSAGRPLQMCHEEPEPELSPRTTTCSVIHMGVNKCSIG